MATVPGTPRASSFQSSRSPVGGLSPPRVGQVPARSDSWPETSPDSLAMGLLPRLSGRRGHFSAPCPAGETTPQAPGAAHVCPCHGTAPDAQALSCHHPQGGRGSSTRRVAQLRWRVPQRGLLPGQEAALTKLAVPFHVQLEDTVGDGGGSRDLQHHAAVPDHGPVLRGRHLWAERALTCALRLPWAPLPPPGLPADAHEGAGRGSRPQRRAFPPVRLVVHVPQPVANPGAQKRDSRIRDTAKFVYGMSTGGNETVTRPFPRRITGTAVKSQRKP